MNIDEIIGDKSTGFLKRSEICSYRTALLLRLDSRCGLPQ
jgi:hypothetical protein